MKFKQLPKGAYIQAEMDKLEKPYHKLEFKGFAPLFCHGHKPCEQGGFLLEYHLENRTEVYHIEENQWDKWTVMPVPMKEVPQENKEVEPVKVAIPPKKEMKIDFRKGKDKNGK